MESLPWFMTTFWWMAQKVITKLGKESVSSMIKAIFPKWGRPEIIVQKTTLK
jgi:hypothetical protein